MALNSRVTNRGRATVDIFISSMGERKLFRSGDEIVLYVVFEVLTASFNLFFTSAHGNYLAFPTAQSIHILGRYYRHYNSVSVKC